MSENPQNYTPPKPDEVIAHICENGSWGGSWVHFEYYSKEDLETIKAILLAKIEKDGDKLTQQISPLGGGKLTYRKVLTNTLSSLQQALDAKEKQKVS